MASKGSRNYRYVDRSSEPIIRFRLKVVFIIFIIVFAACFAVYMMGVNVGISGESESGGEIRTASESESAAESDSSSVASNEIINPVPLSEKLSETYLGKCAFVGDSLTAGLSDYQYVSSKNVIAEVGLNIDKINTQTIRTGAGEKTALEALVDLSPENIYIMLGSNGIEWLSDKDMIGYYKEFTDSVKKALPDSKIYILSIPPVTSERETASDNPIKNSDIDRYNSALLDMANENQMYYVDLNTALKGNDGKFSDGDAADDGMHFNKATYQVMIDYILSHTAQ